MTSFKRQKKKAMRVRGISSLNSYPDIHEEALGDMLKVYET